MGRAFEVRKAAMARGNLEKTKRYSRYGRDIAHLAKIGGADPTANLSLRRLIDEAKRAQIPSDIIDRALAKGAGSDKDDFREIIYEIIGPAGSNLLVVCLSDNVNRTLSDIRAVINKTKTRLADQGSVLHQYQQLSYYLLETEYDETLVFDFLENDIEIIECTSTEDGLIIYATPAAHHKIGTLLTTKYSHLNVLEDDIIFLSESEIELDKAASEQFNLLLELLANVEDFSKVFHNVKEDLETDN